MYAFPFVKFLKSHILIIGIDSLSSQWMVLLIFEFWVQTLVMCVNVHTRRCYYVCSINRTLGSLKMCIRHWSCQVHQDTGETE